jgi:hypothetical protein
MRPYGPNPCEAAASLEGTRRGAQRAPVGIHADRDTDQRAVEVTVQVGREDHDTLVVPNSLQQVGDFEVRVTYSGTVAPLRPHRPAAHSAHPPHYFHRPSTKYQPRRSCAQWPGTQRRLASLRT